MRRGSRTHVVSTCAHARRSAAVPDASCGRSGARHQRTTVTRGSGSALLAARTTRSSSRALLGAWASPGALIRGAASARSGEGGAMLYRWQRTALLTWRAPRSRSRRPCARTALHQQRSVVPRRLAMFSSKAAPPAAKAAVRYRAAARSRTAAKRAHAPPACAQPPPAPVAPGSSPVGSAGLSAVIGYASAVLFKTLASSVLIIFASELALLKVRPRGLVVLIRAWSPGNATE